MIHATSALFAQEDGAETGLLSQLLRPSRAVASTCPSKFRPLSEEEDDPAGESGRKSLDHSPDDTVGGRTLAAAAFRRGRSPQSRDLSRGPPAPHARRAATAPRRPPHGPGTGHDATVGPRPPASDRPRPPGRLRRRHHDPHRSTPGERGLRTPPPLPQRQAGHHRRTHGRQQRPATRSGTCVARSRGQRRQRPDPQGAGRGASGSWAGSRTASRGPRHNSAEEGHDGSGAAMRMGAQPAAASSPGPRALPGQERPDQSDCRCESQEPGCQPCRRGRRPVQPIRRSLRPASPPLGPRCQPASAAPPG